VAIALGLAWSGGAAWGSAVTQAKPHLLVLSDMPSGWKVEGPASSSSNNFPGATQLAACIGVPARLITSNPPTANSPYFSNSTGQLEVQDSVSVFPSAKNAQAEYRAMANPKTPGCLNEIFNTPAIKSQLAGSGSKGATVGHVSVARLAGALPSGVVGFTVKLPITTQGVKVTALLTTVVLVRGTLGQQIVFNSYGSAFPTSLATRLTQVALNRL
jgi:hypothetical protein